jgi:hypothetical protein
MVGLKAGSNLGESKDYFTNITNELEDEGDLALGANIQALSGQFNLNTSRFLLDGLTLGVRFGMMRLPEGVLSDNPDFSNLTFDTLSFGVVGSYQVLKEKTIVPVLLKWRGLSLGTGFIYQHTGITFATKVSGDYDYDFAAGADEGTLTLDPKLEFSMTTDTFTIPLEVTTAIQLLTVMNIHLGLGADLAFGKNDMSLGLSGDVNLEDLPTDFIQQTEPGNLSVKGGGKMAPTIFNFKIMTGFGFKFGPVILDFPVTLYPLLIGGGTGANVGFTLGVSL